MLASFFVPGGTSGAGWTQYRRCRRTPEYSGRLQLGQTLWLVSHDRSSGSLAHGLGQLHHDHHQHAGAGDDLVPHAAVTWALFITAILILLAVPVLTGALILLLFDQTIGTTFFAARVRRLSRCSGSTCSGSSATPRSTS
jgi:cytochrome c oxidase subunit I